jgi:hypothetical protein
MLLAGSAYFYAAFRIWRRQRSGAWVAILVASIFSAAQLAVHSPQTLLGMIPNLTIVGLVIANWRSIDANDVNGHSR